MNKKLFVLLPAMMMVLAACGGKGSTPSTSTSTSSTSTSTSTSTSQGEKTSIQKAYEAGAKLENKAETTETYEFTGTVSAKNGKQFILQDGDYGMYVYATEAYEGVAVDKKVTVVATIKNYNGIIETGTITSVTVVGEGEAQLPVKVTSRADLNKLKQNIIVNFVGNMPEELGAWNSGSSPIVSLTVGSDNIDIKFDKAGYSEEKGKIYNKAADHEVNFFNAVTTAYDTDGHTEANQFLFAESSDFSITPVRAESVTLTADEGKTEVAIGETITFSTEVLPENSTEEAEIFISDGTEYATISGNVLTGVAQGTVKVKAKAGIVTSDEVSIEVKPAGDPVVSLEVTGPTAKFTGEQLAASELTVTATRQSSASEVVTEFSCDPALPYTFVEGDIGTKEFNISFGGVSKKHSVTVTAEPKTVEYAYTAGLALGKGEVTSKEYTFTGVCTGLLKNSFFVQDNGYGMYVYSSSAVTDLAVGKNVTVTATIKNYNGWIETGSTSAITVLEAGTLPEAIEIKDVTELATLRQNVLISFEADMPTSLPTWSSSSAARPKATLGSGQVTISFDKYVYTEELNTAYQSTAGETAKITGAYGMAYDGSAGKTTVNQISFASTSTIEKVAKEVSSIAVKTAPTKVEYASGEKFNPEGLVITVTYADSSAKDVAYADKASDFTFTPDLETALQATDDKVTITYGGKSVDQAITVSSKSLESIAVKTAPTTVAYQEGDKFDPTGLEITLNYNDSSTLDLTYAGNEGDFSFSPALDTKLTQTDDKVTITYGGKSVDQTITVSERTSYNDKLTASLFKATATTYTDFSNVTVEDGSDAVYAGQSAKNSNGSIQLRSKNSNSGIVSTTSGGKIAKVVIVWDNETVDDRSLSIYGSNTAYSGASDLYSDSTAGTLLGSIVKGGETTELTISGDYAYIGLRSTKDAIMIASITITWNIK